MTIILIRIAVLILAGIIGAVWPPFALGGGLAPLVGAAVAAAVAAALMVGFALLNRGTPGIIFGGIIQDFFKAVTLFFGKQICSHQTGGPARFVKVLGYGFYQLIIERY